MLVNVVTTISGRCKRCYSCIRNCPAKAIRVVDGQAAVVPELCIGCGRCVEVCSQNAKMILSGIETAREAIKTGQAVALLAPSFLVAFYPVDPGQLIAAVKKLGFVQVWEVAYGAELVSDAYNKALQTGQSKHCISTSCPVVVNLVEKHYPDLIPYLFPIVSPMVALGRHLKTLFGSDCPVVFAGPCLAKKDEANNPMMADAVDSVLTFTELEEMFQTAGIKPDEMIPEKWDSPPAGLARMYPVSGGFLKSAGLQLDPLDCQVAKVEGKDDCIHFFNSFRENKNSIQMADVLFCEGCISGPMLKSRLTRLERQRVVARYAREKAAEGFEKVEVPAGLNLSCSFRNRNVRLPQPSESQIRAVLTELGKFSTEDELNCGACGYSNCREKAVAVYRGLAESKMCLPFLVSNLESHNLHLRSQLTSAIGIESFIGNSPAMQRIYEIIKKVAPTGSTVLIRGKSGTGKELVAQELHRKSLRADRNFVSINCAALPGSLLESELFGHAKGSFTGAVSEKKGLFEEVNGGTLFLDEIGDVSSQLQAKLLRVLQEGEFLRIGETTPRKINVRIIAATNQNLEEMISRKKFREDLYYRLNVVSIVLPDLKDRKEDIPVLIRCFLNKFNKKHNKEIFSVSKEAMLTLAEADWPGNVRELENAVERAVILCESSEITLEDLPPSLVGDHSHNFSINEVNISDYNQAIQAYKRRLILGALQNADGIQSKAAKQLGIGRSTLNEIMKKLNVSG